MDWKLKLKALLHDPPYKLLVLANHKEEAQRLFQIFITENVLENDIKTADALASAQSRIIVKPNYADEERSKEYEKISQVDFSETMFIDIFSEKQEKCQSPHIEEVKILFDKIGNLTFLNQDERARFIFLFLWRFYPEIFPEIEKHPADSRAPNHSIYDHLVQTSAIVSALPRPAFLLFTIGPVQSFISKARKTSDLWAGSYMLSCLIWESMKPIVENFGPDSIIYPNLLKQPVVDRWLYSILKNTNFNNFTHSIFREWFDNWKKQENKNNRDLDEKLTIANFPNRFLAIIPYDQNNHWAKQGENKFKNILRELAGKAFDKLKVYANNQNIKSDIEKQLLNYFQCYWVVLPWVSANNNYSPDDALDDYKSLLSENELYKTILEIVNHSYYQPPNVGSAYSLLVELTEKLLGTRKSIRDFEQLDQPGEKCHLCGEFEILKIDWDRLRTEKIGLIKKGERLCSICLTKRLFPEIIKEKLNLSEEIKFPSTPEMASIGEKRGLAEEVKDKFVKKFEEFNNKIKMKNPEKIFSSTSIPALKNDSLYGIDGQWLMVENYREDYFEKEYGLKVSEEDFKDIVEFLQKNSIKPSKYYAILQMDGDNMAKWLKGEFNPKIENVIHQKAKDALLKYSVGEEKSKLQKILCLTHPTSPSIHQAFSRKLSLFALEHVRRIVEGNHFGKLVYAGGDDVLALLPVEEVLKCGYGLQRAFKEILSPKASMSAGILIVHYKYPLYLALREVREVEKRAKNHYGRNSFCLTFLTHSGEKRECGGNWELIGFIDDLICKFRSDEISSTFPYQYLEVVENLLNREQKDNISGVRDILRSELKRTFLRKECDKKFLNEYFEKEILPRFEELDIYNFANMLVISKVISEEYRI